MFFVLIFPAVIINNLELIMNVISFIADNWLSSYSDPFCYSVFNFIYLIQLLPRYVCLHYFGYIIVLCVCVFIHLLQVIHTALMSTLRTTKLEPK